MISEAEVFRILDNLTTVESANAVNSTDLLGIYDQLVDKLVLRSPFTRRNNQEVLKNSTTDPIQILSDVLKVEISYATTLWNDSLQEIVKKMKNNNQLLTKSMGFTSLKQIEDCRREFFQIQKYQWNLLLILIRIAVDKQHPLQSPMAKRLDDLIKGNLVKKLVEYTIGLFDWIYPTINENNLSAICKLSNAPMEEQKSYYESLSMGFTTELNQFMENNSADWLTQYLTEFQNVLEVLITLTHFKQILIPFPLIIDLLIPFLEKPFATTNKAIMILYQQSNSPQNAANKELNQLIRVGIQQINFKFICFSVTNFQFWKFFQNVKLIMDETFDSYDTGRLFDKMESNEMINQINSSIRKQFQVLLDPEFMDQIQITDEQYEHLQFSYLIFYLWKSFYYWYSPQSQFVQEDLAQILDLDIIPSLNPSIEPPNLNENIASKFNICSYLIELVRGMKANMKPHELQILQDALNVIIQFRTLRYELLLTHNDSGPAIRAPPNFKDLHSVIELIDFAYSSNDALNEDLSAEFWEAWKQASESNPLCRLVHALLLHSSHEPYHLFSILSSLASTPSSTFQILQLLNETTKKRTICRYGDMKYCRTQSLGYPMTIDRHHMSSPLGNTYTNLTDYSLYHPFIPPGTEVMYSYTGIREKQKKISMPVQRDIGVIISNSLDNHGQVELNDMPLADQRCIVEWESECTWWAIIIDMYVDMMNNHASVILSSIMDPEQLTRITSLFRITGVLMAKQRILTAHYLETKWNEFALFALVQDMPNVTKTREDSFQSHMRSLQLDGENIDNNNDLYLLLSENNWTITRMKLEFKIVEDAFYHLGLTHNQINALMPLIYTPSHKEFYHYSCSEMIATALMNTFISTIKALIVFQKVNGQSPLRHPVQQLTVTTSLIMNDFLLVPLPWSLPIVNIINQMSYLNDSLHYGSRAANTTDGQPKLLFYDVIMKVVSSIDQDFMFQLFQIFTQQIEIVVNLVVSQPKKQPIRLLFEYLDENGDMKISREELSKGLKFFSGQDISVVDVDQLFVGLGLKDHDCIEYSNRHVLSSVDSILSELNDQEGSQSMTTSFVNILRSLSDDNLVVNQSEFSGIFQSCMEFILNQWLYLIGWINISESDRLQHVELLLKCVQVIDKVLSISIRHHKDVQTSVDTSFLPSYIIESSTYLVNKLLENMNILEFFVQMSILFAIISTTPSNVTKFTHPDSMKDLLQLPKALDSNGNPSFHRLNEVVQFSILNDVIATKDLHYLMEKLLELSERCSSIMVQLIDFNLSKKGSQHFLTNVLSIYTSSSQLPACLSYLNLYATSPYHSRSGSSGFSNLNYLVLLSAMPQFSLELFPIKLIERIRLNCSDINKQLIIVIATYVSMRRTNEKDTKNYRTVESLREVGNKNRWTQGSEDQQLYSIIDYIGVAHFPSITKILCEALLYEANKLSTQRKVSPVRNTSESILNYLLTMLQFQPIAFSLLIGVDLNVLSAEQRSKLLSTTHHSSTSSRTESLLSPSDLHLNSSPADNALLHILLHILSKVEDYYEFNPMALKFVYRIFSTLFQTSSRNILLNSALYLVNSPKFWEYITRPLMHDFLSLNLTHDVLGLHQRQPSDILNVGETLFILEESADGLDEIFDEKFSSTFTSKSGNDVMYHSHRTLVHAEALQLLSLERYGILFELDVKIAHQIQTKLQNFYKHATELNRFTSWIKHYLNVDIDLALYHHTIEDAQRLGIHLPSIIQPSSNVATPRRGLPNQLNHVQSLWPDMVLQDEEILGQHFGYDGRLISHQFRSFWECVFFRRINFQSATNSIDMDDLQQMHRFCKDIAAYNLNASIASSQLVLLQSCRQFLEYYVMPINLMRFEMEPSAPNVNETPRSYLKGNPKPNIPYGLESPMTSDVSASPLTQLPSTFTGDKRSYEIVKVVMTSLLNYQSEKVATYVDHPVGCVVMEELSLLLTNMLHHQLKTVTLRTADPSKAQIISRDIASLRLNQDKIEERLDDLIQCFISTVLTSSQSKSSSLSFCSPGFFLNNSITQSFLSLTQNSAVMDNLSKCALHSINLQLLISMMLLISAFHSRDSSDAVLSPFSARMRQVFHCALHALKSCLSRDGIQAFNFSFDIATAFTLENQSEKKNGSEVFSTNYNKTGMITSVSIHLLTMSLPHSVPLVENANQLIPSISISETDHWRRLFLDNETIEMFLNILDQLMILTKDLPKWENDYSSWNHQDLVVGSAGNAFKSLTSTKQKGNQNNGNESIQKLQSYSVALLGILDMFVKAMEAEILSISDTYTFRLLQILLNAPLLKEYQSIILSQPNQVVSSFMGYDAVSAEVSNVSKCWQRSLNIFEIIATKLHNEFSPPHFSLNSTIDIEDETSPQWIVLRIVCRFVNHFFKLIVTPIRPVTLRYTVRQLELMANSVSLFMVLHKHARVWRALTPEVNPVIVVEKSILVFKSMTLLLWHADEQDFVNKQRRLLDHILAVSERPTDEKSSSQIRDLFGVALDTDTNVEIDSNEGIVTPITALHDAHLRAQKKDYHLNPDAIQSFLVNVERKIISSMVIFVTYLRQITPDPMENVQIDDAGRPVFPLGALVYYECDGEILNGNIVNYHRDGSFDVILPNNLSDNHISLDAIRYTTSPLFDFTPISEITKRSLYDPTNVSGDYARIQRSNRLDNVGSPVFYCSTAHIFRALQYVRSPLTMARFQSFQFQSISQDLSLLMEQLSWLILANIAHHAHAPMSRNIPMIQQLDELNAIVHWKATERSTDIYKLRSISRDGTETPSSIHRIRSRNLSEGSGTFSGNMIAGPELQNNRWEMFANWIGRCCDEICIKLGRPMKYSCRDVIVVSHETPEETEKENKKFKKRIGLRAKIEWVRAPEDI